MPLTGLHVDWQYGSYENDRNEHVRQRENTTRNKTRPYYDHSIGIGYGYDLITRVAPGGEINPATGRRSYRGLAPEIISDLNAVNDFLGLQGDQRVTITQADINLLAEARLNQGNRDDIRRRLALAFPSDRFADNLLYLLVGRYETALNAALGGAGELLQSRERIAVISLAYHMSVATAAGIRGELGRALSAITNDNRAEAWYIMRYASNRRHNSDRARRCYAESDFFDLYDNGSPAGLAARNKGNYFIVPTSVGVNQQHERMEEDDRNCPHERGGEPIGYYLTEFHL
jgi:hypothetical protein